MWTSVRGYDLRQCSACGFVTVVMPTDFRYADLYGPEYFHGHGFDSSALVPEARSPDPRITRFRNYIVDVVSNLTDGRALLDIGCGAGALMDVARSRGWATIGQDIGESGVAEARRRGHEVHRCTLEDLPLEPDSIDAATMVEVIEHISDPRSTLKAALRALKPNAPLLITTGDIGAIRARLAGRNWRYIRPPGHVVYYTKSAISALLHRVGFTRVMFVRPPSVAYPDLPPRLAPVAVIPGLAAALRRLSCVELCVIATS